MINKNDLKRKSISAMFYSFGGILANNGIQFIVGIVLARLLLPKDYGLLGMIMVFLAISDMFIDGGMTTALIREKEVSNEDYSTVFYYNLILAIFMYVVLFLTATSISQFFKEPILTIIIRVISLKLIIASFGLIQRVMLTKQLNFKTQTGVDMTAAIISGLIGIYFAYHKYGIWALVIQQITGQVITSTLLMIHNRWFPLLIFSWKSFKKFFGFGWKMLLTGLLATLYHNIYNLIIGKAYLATELGYYTKAKTFSDLPAVSITNAASKVVYPLLSNVQDDKDVFKAGFKKIIKNLNFIIFPIMLGLAVVAEPFIQILFGHNWLPMVPYFQILCLSGATLPHRSINLNILQIKGRSDLFLAIDFLNIIIGLASIGIVVVLELGIYGLLWSLFFDNLIAVYTNSFFSKRFISYSTMEQLKDMIPAVISAIIMGAIVYIVGKLLPFGSLLTLLTQVFTGIVVYIGASKLFRIQELDTILQLFKMGIKKVKSQFKRV